MAAVSSFSRVAEEAEFYAAIEPTLVALRDQTRAARPVWNGGSRAGNMCMCWRPSEPKKSEAKASAKGKPLSAHKFNLGQRVEYRPPSGTSASHGTHVIVAKLGEQGGEFEYYIRSVTQEQDERMARESELNAVGDRSPS